MNEISVILNLRTAEALEKLNGFVESSVDHLKELAITAAEVFGLYEAGEKAMQFTEGIHAALELEESLSLMNQQTGLSVPLLESLRERASELEISFEGLQKSVQRFGRNVYDAATGQSSAAVDMFQRIGVAVNDADGKMRNVDDVLKDVADRFKGLESGAEKTNAAMTLFGRSGANLIPILSEGSEEIERMRELGGPISAESAMNARELGIQMQKLHINAQLVMVTFANELLPAIKEVVDYLNSIDFGVWAQKIGDALGLAAAFPRLVIEAWKAGQFPELISLMIEAGFELAEDAIKVSWMALWKSLTGATAGQIYLTLIDAVMTFGVKASQVITEALFYPVSAFAAAFDYAWGGIKYGAQGVANFIRSSLESVINSFIYDWNASIGAAVHKTFSEIKIPEFNSQVPPNWQESWDAAKTAAAEHGVTVVDWLQKQLEASRAVLGTNENLLAVDDKRLTAIQRLEALLQMVREQQKKPEGGAAHPFTGGTPSDEAGAEQIKLASQWNLINEQIYQQQVKMIQANPYMSQIEELNALLPLMDAQLAKLREQVSAAQGQIINSRTDTERVAATKEMVKLQGQLLDLEIQEQKLKGNFDLTYNVKTQLVTLTNEYGNWARDVGKLLMSPITGFHKAFEDALDKMLTTGKINFATFGLSILSTIRQSFVNMVADWVTSHIVMKGISIAFNALLSALGWAHVADKSAQQAASVAAGDAQATANLGVNAALAASYASLWTTAATLATIASWGGAALAAPAEIAASTAIVAATSAIPRESGGPVSAGGLYLVGEKRPELFVPNTNGTILPSVPSPMTQFTQTGASGSRSSTPNINVAVHSWGEERAMTNHIKNNPQVHHIILDKVRRAAQTIPARSVQ